MPSETRLFYVLVPTYRMIRGVPVVHLYGVTDRGESVLAVDDRPRPYVFVPRGDLDAARELTNPLRAESEPDLTDLDGHPVARLSFPDPRRVPALREKLADAGIPFFEADVRYAYRYMIDHGIRGVATIEGPTETGRHTDLVFRRPTFSPGAFVPELKTLSIDIETSRHAHEVWSVALVGAGLETVLIRRDRPVEGAESVPDERTLIAATMERIQHADPDILTGWNFVDFDLTVLDRRATELGMPFRIGRGDETISFQDDASFTRSRRALVAGRQVLDGILLVRDTGRPFEDFRLNTVAAAVLGREKLASGASRVEEIERAFREDPEWLARYNLEDARLVLEILDETKALDLARERSLLTGMPLDRVGASVATFDFVYLPEARKAGRVAPTVGGDLRAGYVVGGTVLDSRPGIFPNVAVLDFKSLYPSIIRTFGIDPVAFAGAGDPQPGEIVAPNGARFRRESPILPRIIETLWERRDRAKREGDLSVSTAVKLLMNSFYGVLGTNSCRFASAPVANAITSFGGEILRRTKREIEVMGHEVIYGDTDSVFVLTGAPGVAGAREIAEGIRDHVNRTLGEWTVRAFEVESCLELELEKVYRRFFLPQIRGGGEGSKKRYAGYRDTDGEPVLELIGLEAVRRDWPEAGRRFQTELLTRVFRAEDVDDFVLKFVRALRKGEMDEGLVYRKVLRKDPDEYVKTSPPHVRAARLAGKGKGSAIRYVVTREGPYHVKTDGPIPKGLDYDHYVNRVLEPIATAILPFLGKRFDEISGDDPQMTLF
jgi:DNA polymerase-2